MKSFCNIMNSFLIVWALFFRFIITEATSKSISIHHPIKALHRPNSSVILENVVTQKKQKNWFQQLRGGVQQEQNKLDEDENYISDDDETEKDEERYSRQLYTLGARAHSLIRMSTIIIDGPTGSGLLYESVKNLALSGVGTIIILTSNNNESDEIDVQKESKYFNNEMDDLGIMYKRGAQAECFPNLNDNEDVDELELLTEYVRRLNPNVKIRSTTREKFTKYIQQSEGGSDIGHNDMDNSDDVWDTLGDNPVFLSVDRPQSSQVSLNDICRKGKIPFVSIETAGCYGRVFCDFGDNFYVVDEDGETPQSILLEKVEPSQYLDKQKAGDITVHCVEGEHHDVSKGDTIEFHWKNDSYENMRKGKWVVVFVQNPVCFTAQFIAEDDDDSSSTTINELVEDINKSAHSFSRIKIPKEIHFIPLSEALDKINNPRYNLFAASDLDKSFDTTRRAALMKSFEALDTFVGDHHRLPNPLCNENASDRTIFWDLCDSESNPSLVKFFDSFVTCCRAKFVPLQAIYGALGAQEVLKAASRLYNPICQFLLYDCDEVLEGVEEDDRTIVSPNSKAQVKGMKYILGKKVARKLASEKIFVVGSGAIGCELLKNLAAMDAATQKKKGGSIILTDMDTIEKSNLSRQFLFRDADVGKFKSAAAEEAVKKLNPRVQMDTHTSKVGDDNASKETYFNDKFWSDGVNIVMNALDNVEARLFMDSQCVANRKAMIDAGTLGAKGNVQVVVPCQSESYGSSADPPEPTIAVCTLKNFPYQISHTIQWGRDLFDGLFSRRPSQVNEYYQILSSTSMDDFVRDLVQKLGEEAATETASELAEDMIIFNDEDQFENVKKSSIQWAVLLSQKLFYVAINELLRQHPLDSVDDDGEPFWTGTRRAPSPLLFDDGTDISEEAVKINDNLIDFVRFAARLRIETYLSTRNKSKAFSDVSIEEAKLALQSHSSELESKLDKDVDQSLVDHLKTTLQTPKAFSKSFDDELKIASFEKDDEENGHVAFVTAASNLRAIAYGIPPVDQMETRRIAGKIVPAMISTTALVSALSCIELIKILQNAPLGCYRNAFVNLALPFFAFTAPLPAEKIAGLNGNTHTIWDRITVKESEKSKHKGGINLRHFIRQLRKVTPGDSVEVSNISFGPYMLFANFLYEDDDAVLEKPMIELITEALLSKDEDFDLDDEDIDHTIDTEKLSEFQLGEVQALRRRPFIDLSVIVEDSTTGEEAELPPVRLKFFASD